MKLENTMKINTPIKRKTVPGITRAEKTARSSSSKYNTVLSILFLN